MVVSAMENREAGRGTGEPQEWGRLKPDRVVREDLAENETS